jgi:carboxylate-amine ligase
VDWHATERAWTLGVEEELMLVDATGKLVNAAPQILEAAGDRHLQQELWQSMIEVTTPPTPASQISDAIRHARSRAFEAASAAGCLIASSAMHPTAEARQQKITAEARYKQITRQHPVIATLLVYGLHVHVCVPERELAVRVHQSLSQLAPDLIALAANSPFSAGSPTGLASTRAQRLLQLPRTGCSPSWKDWAHYSRDIAQMIERGEVKDATWIWHDVRLQPRYGTVEVRAFDAQPDWRTSAALARLTCALARHVAKHPLTYDPQAAGERRTAAAEGRLELDPLIGQIIDELAGPDRTQLRKLIECPGWQRQRDAGPSACARELSARTTR